MIEILMKLASMAGCIRSLEAYTNEYTEADKIELEIIYDRLLKLQNAVAWGIRE